MREQIKPGDTPATITVSMIDQDLKDGVSKSDMAVKYGIKPWEVDEMFKHPFLKGRRPSRKKALSFSFVDDLEPKEEEFVDPNQVTLQDAIDSAIESAEEAKDALAEAVETIDEIFPTEITGIPNGDTMSDTDDDELEPPSFEDTMDLVEEQEMEAGNIEEELEEEDEDTFEL